MSYVCQTREENLVNLMGRFTNMILDHLESWD